MTITQPRLHARYMKPGFTLLGSVLGVSAILSAAGCGAGTSQSAFAQPGMAAATGGQPGAPIVVSCEPNQRTLVRPVVLNGATLSQVECITNGPAAVSPSQYAAPLTQSYRQAAAPRPVFVDRGDDLGDTRVVPVSDTTFARPIPAARQVYTDARPVQRTRSVKKSAIIIGSSAGAGAGVGAAVGGKKGALIGAVIGGGGATLWDQLTRRNR